MLSPEQYRTWPAPLVALAERLEAELLQEIACRLAKEGFTRLPATGYQQAAQLIDWQGLPLETITQKLAALTGRLMSEIDRLFTDAYTHAYETVGYLYEALGRPVPDNPLVRQTLQAQAEKTKNTFRNLTGSTGFMLRQQGRMIFTPLAQVYQRTLDYAQLQIFSGGFAPDRAIRDAVRALADSGLRTVDYASGLHTALDVAVRRATVTGLSQVTGMIAEAQAGELDTDLVEVSAHGGARDTGTGFENHKAWQGKVYSLSGRHPRYPSLRAATGYGDAAGLKGANCRHDFSPFLEGISRRQWTDAQLRAIDPPPTIYEGVRYTAYQARQRQRQMEDTLRKAKRRCIAYRAAGLSEEAQAESARIAGLREGYLAFSRAVGLESQLERARVGGYRS